MALVCFWGGTSSSARGGVVQICPCVCRSTHLDVGYMCPFSLPLSLSPPPPSFPSLDGGIRWRLKVPVQARDEGEVPAPLPVSVGLMHLPALLRAKLRRRVGFGLGVRFGGDVRGGGAVHLGGLLLWLAVGTNFRTGLTKKCFESRARAPGAPQKPQTLWSFPRCAR